MTEDIINTLQKIKPFEQRLRQIQQKLKTHVSYILSNDSTWQELLEIINKIHSAYFEVLFANPTYSNENQLDENLWKASTYESIDICRLYIAAVKNKLNEATKKEFASDLKTNTQKLENLYSVWLGRLDQTLSISKAFYTSIVLEFKARVDIPECLFSNVYTFPKIPSKDSLDEIQILKILQRSYIYLGDLERYNITYFASKKSSSTPKWATAEIMYKNALQIYPPNSRGFAQLAIINNNRSDIPSAVLCYAQGTNYPEPPTNILSNQKMLSRQYFNDFIGSYIVKKSKQVSDLTFFENMALVYSLEHMPFEQDALSYTSIFILLHTLQAAPFKSNLTGFFTLYKSALLHIFSMFKYSQSYTSILAKKLSAEKFPSTSGIISGLPTRLATAGIGNMIFLLECTFGNPKDLPNSSYQPIDQQMNWYCASLSLYIDFYRAHLDPTYLSERNDVVKQGSAKSEKGFKDVIEACCKAFNNFSQKYLNIPAMIPSDKAIHDVLVDISNTGTFVDMRLFPNKVFTKVHQNLSFTQEQITNSKNSSPHNTSTFELKKVLACRIYVWLTEIARISSFLDLEFNSTTVSFNANYSLKRKQKIIENMAIMAESRLRSKADKIKGILESETEFKDSKLANNVPLTLRTTNLMIPDISIWLYNLPLIQKWLTSKKYCVLLTLDAVSKLDIYKKKHFNESHLARTALREIELILQKRATEMSSINQNNIVGSYFEKCGDPLSVQVLLNGNGLVTQHPSNSIGDWEFNANKYFTPEDIDSQQDVPVISSPAEVPTGFRSFLSTALYYKNKKFVESVDNNAGHTENISASGKNQGILLKAYAVSDISEMKTYTSPFGLALYDSKSANDSFKTAS